jgi:hypothetical protein
MFMPGGGRMRFSQYPTGLVEEEEMLLNRDLD